jgi:hypothetical protein
VTEKNQKLHEDKKHRFGGRVLGQKQDGHEVLSKVFQKRFVEICLFALGRNTLNEICENAARNAFGVLEGTHNQLPLLYICLPTGKRERERERAREKKRFE